MGRRSSVVGRQISRKVRQSIASNDDKYRILVEQASDGIAIYDRYGKLLEVNTRACELVGYSRDELLTMNVAQVIAPDNLEETPLRYEELRTGRPLLGERVLKRKDGTSVPVELSARMLSDGRFQVIVRDITQRKVMEAEIRRLNADLENRVALRTQELEIANRELKAEIAERKKLEKQVRKQSAEIKTQYERLAHIIDEMPVGVFIAEGNLRTHTITWKLANRVGQEQMGMQVRPGEPIGNRPYTILRPDGSPIMEADLPMQATLWGTTSGGQYELLLRYPDGTECFLLQSVALLSETATTREVIVVAQDITDRKRQEAERARLLDSEQQARREAEMAVQVRDELLAIVSHDLKNPLAAIKGNSQLLRKRIPQSGMGDVARVLAPIGRIDEATTRMSVLINDLLDFGRLQAGQALTLQRRLTDLVALVRNVANEFQQTTETHSFKVVTELDHLNGMWDSLRLEQVLDNLLSNAIKYSPNGGTITMGVGREAADPNGEMGEWAVLTIHDTGIGIAEDDIQHVFEWFRRARNASGRVSGAGIGLASANYIVTEHGGTINVESQQGKGSTFTVRLPL